jgi:hypothetical protein
VAAGDGQVRVEWGDGNVTYTSVGALPFFGVFLSGYENPGTYEIKVQGGLATGPASPVETIQIVVP